MTRLPVRAAISNFGLTVPLALLLAEAHQARQLLLDSPNTPLTDLARQHGKCRKHLTKLIELACLAPDIVEAIMKDQQPR
ncbi:MAG: hypothetical protein ACKO0Z_16480, partial [Betaproteobacteria bacterium]